MIALYIIGGIVLIFAILLNIPIIASVSYICEEFSLIVKYLWFTIYPRKEKEEEVPESSEETALTETNNDNLAETSDIAEDTEEKPHKLTREEKKKQREEEKRRKKREKRKKEQKKDEIFEYISIGKEILEKSGKPFRRLVKGIKIYGIALDIDVASEDAYEAALNYGKMNIAVYNIIAFLRAFFTVSIDHVNISCKYNSNENRYDGSCEVRVTPATLIAVAVGFFVRFLLIMNRRKKEQKQLEKMSERTANTSARTA